eukprot:scaffold1615_cov103-Isochrysis_galbana.AAC.1
MGGCRLTPITDRRCAGVCATKIVRRALIDRRRHSRNLSCTRYAANGIQASHQERKSAPATLPEYQRGRMADGTLSYAKAPSPHAHCRPFPFQSLPASIDDKSLLSTCVPFPFIYSARSIAEASLSWRSARTSASR